MSRASDACFILNTRAEIHRARTEAAFAGLPWPVVHWPMFTARPTGADWPAPEEFDAVIFTSQIAVPLVPLAWRAKTAYAVGEATAATARDAGFGDVFVTGIDATQMIETLKGIAFRRALYPSATDVAEDVAAALPDKITRLPVYAMDPEPELPAWLIERLRGAARVVAPLFSRRNAAQLAAVLRRAGLAGLIDAIGVSSDVFERGTASWRTQNVAVQPTLDSVVAELRRVIGAEAAL